MSSCCNLAEIILLTLSLQVFPYDTSIRIDPTSVLPVELMQQIHSHLPPGDYLTIKFVSRSFHASTLLASGRDLRGFKGTRDYDDPDHDFYLDAVINLEVCTRYPLELLTCCHCGKRAGNELNGFSDEQFVQADECRGCLKCRKPCSCTIRGVQVARCHWCDTYVTGVEDEFGQWKAEPVHWCVQRRGVRAPWV